MKLYKISKYYYVSYSKLFFLISFFCTIILQIFFSSSSYNEFFNPCWIFLNLIYWKLIFPTKLNINIACIFGISLDIIVGCALGMHVLTFIIIILLLYQKKNIFSYSLLAQSLLVFLLSLLKNFIYFILQIFFYKIEIDMNIFYESIINALIWPFIFLLMNKIFIKTSLLKNY